ncbi:MAG: substrate-binding domain-containing protein [SAR324 cluster bacterium]|nr:substrate-binding domain-containing protein [SAR324 cluster bacterium]
MIHNKYIFTAILYIFSVGSILAEPVRLATTTSTDNSGLIRELLPYFEKETGNELLVISAGTGQALRMGQDGNVDVLLVHEPEAEELFIKAGYGVNRRAVMYNDFIFVGPKSDPAGIKGESDAINTLNKIFIGKHVFISRGDDSGTHKKELVLWEKAGLKPHKSWYLEAGLGMGRVLQIADELNAYTIVDRGTWLAFKSKLSLKLLAEGDKRLHNQYSIIAVNPARYSGINYLGAMSLIAWITSIGGQEKIGNFRINDQILFTPVAVKN